MDERTSLFTAQPAPPPPYESASTSYSPAPSHTLNAQAPPFIPTSFTAPQLCPHQHQHQHQHLLPPPRRSFTPLGPTPYHTLPLPISYEREHATRQADRRARRRFFQALLWGVALYFIMSAIITVGLRNQEELERGVRKGWKEVKRWIRQVESRWDPERLNGGHGIHIFPSDLDISITALPVLASPAELNAEDVQ